MTHFAVNKNTSKAREDARVLFVDMNSYFARCEQQVNYWLRGRPVGVCVYTGRHGCVIAPSVEAKKRGVKTGMRLDEAIQVCPDLVPLETHPGRYRDFHVKIIGVLKKYCQDVIPKSIDEAIVDLTNYRHVYKDPREVALKIKEDIRREAGDWLSCSIGIAPNAFLAKLASDLQKPDGLVEINHDNIDEVLSRLVLTDLPGISSGMAARLEIGGIRTPLQLRHTPPELLRRICRSVVGVHWHYRLNFAEMDFETHSYKSMQAMRQVSSAQRRSKVILHELFLSLCLTLEKRMVQNEVFCKSVSIFFKYANGYQWADHFRTDIPLQDGVAIMNILKERMNREEPAKNWEAFLNEGLTALGVTVTDFIPSDMMQYSLFEDNVRKDNLRKIVYNVKDRFGKDKILRAMELRDEGVLKDVIGFGSVKDLHEDYTM
jgi:DNA polymerase-4